MLPKISRPGTKASIQNEAAVRRRYPPLDGVTASTPHIIVDEHGIILAWYLPGILSDQRQVGFFSLSDHGRQPDASQKDMLAVQGKLGPLLKMAESGSSWQNDQEMYPSGAEGPQASFLDLLPPPSPCIRLKDMALPPRLALVLGPPPPLATPPSLVNPRLVPAAALLQGKHCCLATAQVFKPRR